MRTFAPCVVIPVYNHAQLLAESLPLIRALDVPCVVVNDGGNPKDTELLRTLCRETGSELCEQFPNRGKGSAVILGMRRAAELGYTHAVQVDADGQHNIEDIPRFLALAEQFPQALISGVPEYDESVPRHRFYSRYITHFWVWVETLSLEIRDSMCGFRVYPLAETLALADRVRIGRRMDFDTEVAVRLSWRGMPVMAVPTRVIYPENGISNFRLWRDNLAISWMHTRLCVGMLARLPLLLYRLVRRQLPSGERESQP
ncbi:glycosyltransferase family 2 protein [Marinimicrobium sp. ABcell2]|uniref:glycosyltransferase family 2 protein n=1 Tax=Marinimicrobium sp. ABcell2 TaxID=3069751 RepID=UPI0027B0A99F|nr:glycosyltransferase family 2 protein [Marinimicrobium sp. ABcell2]MDQ2076972.1 glycosyltransferase family 2 protein [Marinimicrobium sp. ABcell2]